ncbi:outer membrane lipoprotein-sorting protein [Persicitalea sp.]|uniref:outer membrane lipoprotein-sorting protein n=1 Tax=Persicitalea sp. TaxID=3100273 RepID=UPI003593A59A
MQPIKILFAFLLFIPAVQAQKSATAIPAKAPTVDSILDKYFEISGGRSRWDSLQNVRMNGTVTVQGMEIPVTIIQTKEGQQKVSIKFQGQETTQMAFDGQTGWSTNFMTQRAEEMNAEANANTKQQVGDFPDAFLHYQDKGYVATLEGTEAIEGLDAIKIKLTKNPVKVDGQSQENAVYYFFDPESYLPVAMRNTSLSGQTKGASVETLLDDYREVEGLLFPFTSTISYNGMPGETIVLERIETNIEVEPQLFAFPK